MLFRHSLGKILAILALVLAVSVSSVVIAGKATSLSLGGEDRYLTFINTDKPIYRPGERVHARGVLLHAFTRAPLTANHQAQVTIEIKGPKGDVVAGGGAHS